MASPWPLTFSSGERPRALWALLLLFHIRQVLTFSTTTHFIIFYAECGTCIHFMDKLHLCVQNLFKEHHRFDWLLVYTVSMTSLSCELCYLVLPINTSFRTISFEFDPNVYNVFLPTACRCLLDGHLGNCKSGIRVCVACVRNSFLNPIQCHSCRGKMTSIVGKEKVSVSSLN